MAGYSDDLGELSTLLGSKFDPSPLPEASYTLEVIEGPLSGQAFLVDGGQPSRVLLGESPACLIRLGDRQVSRRHAALELVQRRLRITDLGSTNGTFVDGVAVLDAYLRGGEIVRVGETALRVEQSAARQPPELSPNMHFGRLIGASTEMRRLYPLCEKIAASNVPTIIEGETGTGKEMLAEALHEMGPRAEKPFVVFDCTSVPPTLLESELFGHERGAFTGAVATRRGVFELADGGTLLLDEIGDLDLNLQPKLLRAVERGEVRRVGADRSTRVDVRVIAATRRDLDQAVAAERFRDDLFHRLAVARIELPPLRKRRGDISMLASYFWRELGGGERPPTDLLLRWEADPWPGNVRQLRNAVARQLALGELAEALVRQTPGYDSGAEAKLVEATAGAAPDIVAEVIGLGVPLPRGRELVVAEFERRYVEHVLALHDGDSARAAAASGIARRYFNLIRARSAR